MIDLVFEGLKNPKKSKPKRGVPGNPNGGSLSAFVAGDPGEDEPEDIGVDDEGGRGSGHPGGLNTKVISKQIKQLRRTGSVNVKRKTRMRVPGQNKFGVHSKNVHASTETIAPSALSQVMRPGVHPNKDDGACACGCLPGKCGCPANCPKCSCNVNQKESATLLEAFHFAGSAEDLANRHGMKASKFRKHVKVLKAAVETGPCPCGANNHSAMLAGTFPKTRTVTTSCPNGMNSMTYGKQDGKILFGKPTPVTAQIKAVKIRQSEPFDPLGTFKS